MYPDDLKYSEKHIWCKKLDGTVEVGYSHYAQDKLGDIIYIELPEVGSEIKKGERIGMVESSKAVSDINSPVSGKITEVNTAVEDAPEEIIALVRDFLKNNPAGSGEQGTAGGLI